MCPPPFRSVSMIDDLLHLLHRRICDRLSSFLSLFLSWSLRYFDTPSFFLLTCTPFFFSNLWPLICVSHDRVYPFPMVYSCPFFSPRDPAPSLCIPSPFFPSLPLDCVGRLCPWGSSLLVYLSVSLVTFQSPPCRPPPVFLSPAIYPPSIHIFFPCTLLRGASPSRSPSGTVSPLIQPTPLVNCLFAAAPLFVHEGLPYVQPHFIPPPDCVFNCFCFGLHTVFSRHSSFPECSPHS